MKKRNKIKLIYNPNAGKKRSLFTKSPKTTLEDISNLLTQYQIEVDYAPTKKPGDAIVFAQKAIKEKYQIVLAAGGDGTVSEVANGLVGSKVTMGILPLGTFMNIARMLSIPMDLEKAVELIKIGRTRKIDVGSVTKIDGEKLTNPYYFLETAGIGLDAELQKAFKEMEDGKILSLFKIFKIYLTFISKPIKITINDKEHVFKSTLVTLSNGPYTGAALHIAPTAKLNDHKLTLSLYKMTKFELLRHFLKIRNGVKIKNKKIKIYQADIVKILSVNRNIHADASLFGVTPVSFKVVPNALNVICGFPASGEEAALKKRTPLDP